MLIQNSLYYNINQYTKKINQYLKNTCIFNCDYKTYDKSQNDLAIFKCWDIKSQIKTVNDFIITDFEYNGSLEFIYSKPTNDVHITKLPYVKFGKDNIPIFTSDIGKIIVDVLNKYLSSDDIKISFSQLQLFATDSRITQTIPSISNTSNYILLNDIITRIDLEERKLKEHILCLKAHQDRVDNARERAVSKKRKIFGIDPNYYENEQAFYETINKKICEVYQQKINKILKHIEASQNKYKKLLKDNLETIISEESLHDYIAYSPIFKKFIKEYVTSINPQSYLGDNYYKEQQDKYIETNWEKFKEEYINYLFNEDLKVIIPIVDYVINSIFTLTYEELFGYDEGCHKDNKTLYAAVINIIKYPDHFRYPEYLDHDYTFYHPIFGSHNYNIVDKYDFARHYLNSNIGRAIELLLQYRTLKEKLEEYNHILDNPSSALQIFSKNKDSWSTIMQYPYFLKLSRDPYKGSGHELFNLLMIKPGTVFFDSDNIRSFIQKRDKKIMDSANRGIPEKIEIFSQNCHRLMITIPDSFQYDSLRKVINYAHNRGRVLNFICQSPDIAHIVKNIIIQEELKARQNKQHYLKDKCFINIDPNYYDSFFVNTPSNKEFWHRYDFTSDYKYRRKTIYDLHSVIDMCIDEYLKQYSNDSLVDYDVIYEMLLGGWDTNDNPFNLPPFNLSEFIHNKELLKYGYLIEEQKHLEKQAKEDSFLLTNEIDDSKKLELKNDSQNIDDDDLPF